ncbi:LutC/YkgG family protein [Thermomonospora amylolytica]|uniref:LutC/YkgG family protein n=1 Tax=Thermomonospora amylolytica TaxID=1411117 RepID=UPI000E6B622E|nr:LUD domain-containing protein [Thermomonospora amylolytica]
MSAREEILARLRTALRDDPAPEEVPRRYRRHHDDGDDLVGLLAGRLADHGAAVHRAGPGELAHVLAEVLAPVGTLVVPADVPDEWTTAYEGAILRDGVPERLTPLDLDAPVSVLTGCALAIAQTGTIVMDGGPAQGRRLLTLLPDHHVCVVPADRVVGGVPEAIARLRSAPHRPLTLISGPSATSDIEFDRVEGVHGPRRLDVVIVHHRGRP